MLSLTLLVYLNFILFLLFIQFFISDCVQFKHFGIVFSLNLSTKFITICLLTMIVKYKYLLELMCENRF